MSNLQTLNQTFFQPTQHYGGAFWSPNSNYVGFGLYYFGQGEEQTDFIVDMTSFKTIDLNVKALRWLDDHWVVYGIERNGEYELELRDLDTNVVYKLDKSDNSIGSSALDLNAVVSPDKQMVVAAPKPYKLIIVSMIDGTSINYTTKLGTLNLFSGDNVGAWGTDLSWLIHKLAWSPDSQLIAFLDGSNTTYDVVIADRSMKEIVRTHLSGALPNNLLKWDTCTQDF